MPSTVIELFEKFKVLDRGVAPWGTKVEESNGGIYIVSLSQVPEVNLVTSTTPSFAESVIEHWISKLPNFTLDGIKPNVDSLKSRLAEFWLPDESILYIGKAKKRNEKDGVGNRISEYYRTEIGDRSPHSGGQWIKTLENLGSTFVHYGVCENPSKVERSMLDLFMSNVSPESLELLRDKSLPLPFANLRYKRGKDKDDGMKNQRKPKQ